MSSSTVVLIIAGATLGGTSLALWQHLQTQREENTALQARIAQLEQRAQQAAAPRAAPDAGAVPLAAGPQIDRQPQPGTGAPQLARVVADPMRGNFLVQRQQRLLEDPEYRAALQAQQRVAMRQMYPDVGTAMKLSPDQVDGLYALLAEQQLRATTDFAAEGTPPPNTPEAQREWARRMEEQQRQNEAEIANLLGHSAAQAWKDYQKTLGARMQVRELRNVLADSPEPLRVDQIEPLVGALAQEEARFHEDMRRQFSQRPQQADHLSLMKQGIEAQLRHNERRRDVVAPYLSNAQLQRFDEMLEQQAAMAKAHLKLAETQPQMSEPGIVVDSGNALATVPVPGFIAAPR